MASTSSSGPQRSKILTLKSSDDKEFLIEESIAVKSVTIKNLVEDGYTQIPLQNVNAVTLKKILSYLKKHAEKTDSILKYEEIKEFDRQFVNVSFEERFVVLLAANYLNISDLMNFLCQSIADGIKNKTVRAVREIFNITNDYTPKEEAEVRAEHEWAHEGEFDDSAD